jgi:hypothetical protein
MAREIRICTVCGAKFFATEDNGSCPVCILRRALPGRLEPDDSPGSRNWNMTSPFSACRSVQ